MRCGGHNPANTTSPEVIARFRDAVGMYNTQANDTLEFVEIVCATQQVVAGFIFRGVIKCRKGGEVGEYEVEVYLKPGAVRAELTRFGKK